MSEIARRDNPLPPEWNRQHRRPPRDYGRLLLAAAAVLLLVVTAGGAAWWTHRQNRAAEDSAGPVAAGDPCPGAELRVAVALEIAPVVQDAARTLNGGSDCGRIAVTVDESAEAPTGLRRPDVWIPSSTAWLRAAAGEGSDYAAQGEPLARTPVVLAAPISVADGLAKGDRTSWAALVAGVAGHRIPAVSMADPLHDTVGLLSVYAVQRAMAGTTPDAGIAQLRALTLRSRLKDAATGPAESLSEVAAQTQDSDAITGIGVFPVTEQQLRQYQRGSHVVELKGALPADGVIEADYPFAIAADSDARPLAERLRAAITPAAVTRAGFRTAATPNALKLPADPAQLLGPAAQWSQYQNLPFQVLLMIDGSGSMNEKITDRTGRTTTKAALLRESGLSASELFGEDTSIGMWFFATPTPASPAHTEVVGFGPITQKVGGTPRRQLLGEAIAHYQAADGAGTPLYQTVLDGEATMRARARPGAVTLVVVLTDGDDDQSRFAMSHDAFLGKLTAQRDPSRPVQIIAVGYGPDADMKSLTDMATATGGKAVAATNPADLASAVAKAFLAVHAPA